MKQKLWAGRSEQSTDKLLDIFNASFRFDFRLWPFDIEASKAHAIMLCECQIINEQNLILIILLKI